MANKGRSTSSGRGAASSRGASSSRGTSGGKGASAGRSAGSSGGKAASSGQRGRPERGPSPAKGAPAPRRASAGAGGGGGGGGASRSGVVKGGAGRTGPIRRAGTPAYKSDRSLGGEQIEGRQAVRELLLSGKRRVREIMIASEMDETGVLGDIIELATAGRVPVTQVSRRSLDLAARSEAPQGVLARAQPLEEAELDTLLARTPGIPPFLLAVDGVTDPGNLGALLRTAEGAGVTGVILPKHRAVHVTPTVAKAAAGAIEHLPIAVVSGLPMALTKARDKGIWIVGLDDDADKTLFEMGDLGAEGIMLVLGAEGAGLSRLVRERCDLVVSIPMAGHLSSLNVAAAGALACYEVTRARRRR